MLENIKSVFFPPFGGEGERGGTRTRRSNTYLYIMLPQSSTQYVVLSLTNKYYCEEIFFNVKRRI